MRCFLLIDVVAGHECKSEPACRRQQDHVETDWQCLFLAVIGVIAGIRCGAANSGWFGGIRVVDNLLITKIRLRNPGLGPLAISDNIGMIACVNVLDG